MDVDRIKNALQWLRGEDGVAPAPDVEDVLGEILQPLLEAEGLALLVPNTPNSGSVTFAAKPVGIPGAGLSVAVEYRHKGGGQAAGIETVHQLLGKISSGPFDRALLISRFGFTEGARDAASRATLQLELHDLTSLSEWIDNVASSRLGYALRVQFLVRSISHEFAKLVAVDALALDHLEWRDVERLIERVMAGIGFSTELTPPSKDGGKDLIVRCSIRNRNESYIVELKHWRAGKPVVKGAVSNFLKVILREKRDGGLFLSTSGYALNASEAISELTTQRLRLGGRTKIVRLCQTYVRAASGLWNPPQELPEILYDGL